MSRIPKDLLARLEYFNSEVDELFQRLFGTELGAGFDHSSAMPSLDLLETEEEIVIRADLPGMNRESIDLHSAPTFVVLRGDKRAQEGKLECLRVERAFGGFQRLVPLPATGDVGRVRATFSRGVLEVRIPKMAERRKAQRRIPIS